MLPNQCVYKGKLMDRMFFVATIYGPLGKKIFTTEYDYYLKMKDSGWFDTEEEAKEFYAPKIEPKKKRKRKKKDK